MRYGLQKEHFIFKTTVDLSNFGNGSLSKFKTKVRKESTESSSSSLERDESESIGLNSPTSLQANKNMFESVNHKKLQNNVTIKIEQYSSVKIMKKVTRQGEIEDIIRLRKLKIVDLSA